MVGSYYCCLAAFEPRFRLVYGLWVLLGPTACRWVLWTRVCCHWMSLSLYGTLRPGRMAWVVAGPALNGQRGVKWYHAAGWRAATSTAHPSWLSRRKTIFVLPVVVLCGFFL